MRSCHQCKQRIPDTSDCWRDHDKKTYCKACAEKAGVKR